ncbi:T6SS phospholipase effector Tle1-like catalytic domain-containing protein [Paraburkholderia adhaesiva]|uniref:T6SS phospholipase effector Tle1-like catalytic domain-containing protein n=1 Tax=Paraburkholderia adhaesiva TaxID=2883244 RepID=UPI001F4782EA|nr:DUF2235 domain-containing protein [Paraburkholderia adhaesiva]
MSLEWPQTMTEGGRLPQSDIAQQTGLCLVLDPRMSCPQTLNITLFFDGTNNNDDPNNAWKDSLHKAHTNVARLRNMALWEPENGTFAFYAPGVGTPFPDIDEELYTTKGKAFAAGFNQRCVWGYAQVLNAIYYAITRSNFKQLIPQSNLARFCNEGALDRPDELKKAVHRLTVAHKDKFDAGQHPRTVAYVWINVIGFSRGAAGARAFVHRLVNKWAPGGQFASTDGRPIRYQVNFMGLFDTVASVGLPDSARSSVDLDMFDGHGDFASGGGLDIPDSVRYVHHAFSIHEQRMSFPLDSIAKGTTYSPGLRCEVAYPGVHSDVGGGYGPGEQGKGKPDDDSHKLSQIALHDMYIAALRFGVPLAAEKHFKDRPKYKSIFEDDFALNPATVEAFNAWVKTTEGEPLRNVGDALKFGMGQMLTWRAMRAQINTADYVTEQAFFKQAHEDALTPFKVLTDYDAAKENDPEYNALSAQRNQVDTQKWQAIRNNDFPPDMPDAQAYEDKLDALDKAIRERDEALCGGAAYPDVKPPKVARPGEGPFDIGTNDQTDLRQGAEEMRLLLGHLYPDQLERWKVGQNIRVNPSKNAYPATPEITLFVKHDQPRSDSPAVTLAHAGFLFKTVWAVIMSKFSPDDDVMAAPLTGVMPFLKQHTSDEAIARLKQNVTLIGLYDNFIHDSHCWFRLHYWHEYAPGGYGWPRVYWAGGDKRVRYFGMASDADLGTH